MLLSAKKVRIPIIPPPSTEIDTESIEPEDNSIPSSDTIVSTTFSNDSGTVTFNVNAELIAPENDTVSLYKASVHFYTSEELERICSAICDNSPVYEYNESLSKSQIEESILEYKKLISDDEYLNDYYDGDQSTIDYVINLYETRISALNAYYETAQDSVTPVLSDYQYHEDSYYVGAASAVTGIEMEGIAGVSSMKAVSEVNGVPLFIWAAQRNDSDYILSNINVYPHDALQTVKEEDYYQTTPVTDTDIEDAESLVLQILSNAGLSNWQIWSVSSPASNTDFIQFQLVPTYNGVPMTPDQNFWTLSGMESYNPMYTYPSLLINISNGKLISFSLEGDLDIIDTITESATLIPQEEILNRIYEQLEISWTADRIGNYVLDLIEDVNAASVEISRIEFTMVRTMVQDDSNSYYITPAWIVYGTPSADDYTMSGQRDTAGMQGPYAPLLILNAIDGSVIDLSQGY